MFHVRNEFERREFILDSTINAIKLTQLKLSKKKLEIKFDELLFDVIEVGKVYLKHNNVIGN